MSHGEDTREDQLSEHDRRLLTALADGSLSPHHAEQLQRRVADSPQLAGALAMQRRAVNAARRLADEPSPRLRAHVERARTARTRPRRRS